MDFEDTTEKILEMKIIEYPVILAIITILVTNTQIDVLNNFIDSMIGKLIFIFLICYLLSQQHYRLAVSFSLLFVFSLSFIRERNDLMTLRNKVQKSSSEKTDMQKKISGNNQINI